MKNRTCLKKLLPISICCILFALLSIAWIPATSSINRQKLSLTAAASSSTIITDVLSIYTSLHLDEKGLSKDAFTYACKGYQHLQQMHRINGNFLTICDLSQSSRKKRCYIINMATGELVLSTYVAHGHNSGAEYARQFSNRAESLQTSLGFYTTGNTYYGEHGLSLHIEGLEKGFNDNALRRNIVIHGAAYMEESWLSKSSYMGRSYGCPAVPASESDFIINTIKNGNCLFIYYPSGNYLKGSRILND